MISWSTRFGVLLLPGLFLAAVADVPASAQVSAASTIAPDNTVVKVAKADAVPTPAGLPTTVPVPKHSSRTAMSTATSASTGAPATAESKVGGLTPGAAQPGVPSSTVVPAPVEAQSFSDPLADLASAALAVLPDGPLAQPSSGIGSDGQALAVVGPAPAIQFAVTPTTVAVDPNFPRPPSSSGTSSMIINTSDLRNYVLGVAIVAPVSQESQKVLAALPTAGAERYVALLRAVTKVVGPRTKTDPAALEMEWMGTEPRRMKAILTAMAQVGTRYYYSGNKPGGFDCSGLISYSWSQAGVKIPRTSALQSQGLPTKSAAELLPGDIVWRPGHVSMYIGGGQAVVDAPQTGKTVLVKRAPASSWVSFHNPF